jgi:hypothetical protein
MYPRAAFAYLDPGSGSYILQIIIGTLIGAAFAIKMYWRKLKVFFVRPFFEETKKEDDDT